MNRTPLIRKTPLKPSQVRMRQKRSTCNPTKAHRARFEAIAASGCLACRMNEDFGYCAASMPVEIHHLLSGGRRIGHSATIGLCHYHHQGKRLPERHVSYSLAAAIYGPSLEREPQIFHAIYGSDAEALILQNSLLTERDGA